jgi:lipopolysaccharide/colanic/teichoic acid biosynthesis glycosyltransferase
MAARRVFDICAAVIGLLLATLLFPVVALAIRATSPGPVFFRAPRLGRNAAPITVLKFRTMTSSVSGPAVTVMGDSRITGVGHLLRRSKIDELPQLINVLRGDMAIVGPRPEAVAYQHWYVGDYATMLSVRPGITSLASVHYRNEEADLASLIADVGNHEVAYRQIWEKKMALDRPITQGWRLRDDVNMVAATIAAIVRRSS